MGYTYISPLGSTPEERLKAAEGIQERSVTQTKEEQKAFCDAMFAAESVIIHRIDGNDVYTYDFKGKGDKELTPAQKANLASRYDFTNLTKDQLNAFLSELSMMGVIKGVTSQVFDANPSFSPTKVFSYDDIHNEMDTQIGLAKWFLERMYAHPNPSLISIDDFERSIATFEKIDKIFKEFMAPDV